MSYITVLTEFKIEEAKRNEFLKLLNKLEYNLNTLGAEDVSIYEGVDQPGLFVEEFTLKSFHAYNEMKKIRCSSDVSFWEEYNSCIAGGSKKLNIWAFKKLSL
ncbi:MFS transporter [Alteribacillus sp. YIM 98480]|uniref:MFS transporter n=1 Tax=Alteribacillus sp. YIM 98480 TaxID=2606599 RepID=UPI00131AD688|nr:MFS transporter [Alteribacillus sp. YIM 98480]